MDETTKLIKELTEAHGVPGYETPVRAVIQKYFEPLGNLSQDKIGSLICQKNGSTEAPRVMLAGHMDEIGFVDFQGGFIVASIDIDLLDTAETAEAPLA